MTPLFHRGATAELEDHVAWYEAQRPGLGDELFAEVLGTLEQLVEQPFLGSPVPDASPARRLILASFPLSVVYRITQNGVFVVAVAHVSRQPGYWRARI